MTSRGGKVNLFAMLKPTANQNPLSWEDKLNILTTNSIGCDGFPSLTELMSCYLSAADGDPKAALGALREFFTEHPLNSVRKLKEELDLFFPEHRRNMASVPNPLYAEGVIENFMKMNGCYTNLPTVSLFKAIRFVVEELYKVVPETSIIEFNPDNYNFGLRNLSAFLDGIPRFPISSPNEIDIGLVNVMKLIPGHEVRRVNAIERVLYDIKSLFKTTDSLATESIVRWNCSEAGLYSYIRGHAVNISGPLSQSLITVWNCLVSELNKPSATYRIIAKDTLEEDKKALIDKFDEISESFLGYLTKDN